MKLQMVGSTVASGQDYWCAFSVHARFGSLGSCSIFVQSTFLDLLTRSSPRSHIRLQGVWKCFQYFSSVRSEANFGQAGGAYDAARLPAPSPGLHEELLYLSDGVP